MPNFVEMQHAVPLLQQAKRVMVIGCSGGGKSTLSQALARHLKLDYQSIDRDVRWLPGWRERSKPEQLVILQRLVAAERWVMDGTNPSTFDLRLPRADLVIWMKLPRLICLRGVMSRWIRNWGRTRPEMAPGCPEKVDWDFLRYIWTFERVFTPKVIAALDAHGPHTPILIVKSREESRRLLDLGGLRH